jgi:YVTN family beta-propeller protein
MRLNRLRSLLILLMLAALGGLRMTTVRAQGGSLYDLPAASQPFVTSSTLALSFDGRTLLAVNPFNRTVSIVAVSQGDATLTAEIEAGSDPRAVAFTPDGARALVTLRGEDQVAVVNVAEAAITTRYPAGVLPAGVVIGADGTAYIAAQGSDEVLVMDSATGVIRQRIPTPPSPYGLLLWSDFLYVSHFWTGHLSLIYLPQNQVVRTISTGANNAVSPAIALDPTRGLAYLPQTRANPDSRSLTYDTTVFPVVNVVDLAALSLDRSARVTLDTADRPVNMPFAAVVDATRRLLFVVNAGSDSLSVIDLESGLAAARIEVDANPRGVILSLNGGTAFVHNAIDGTLTLIETRGFTVLDSLPISDASNIDPGVLIGAQLFHSAVDVRLSSGGWVSCASCHFDGDSDGRVWLAFGPIDGGGRNTPVLYDLAETAPYTWSGDWDELADVEIRIRTLQAGLGLIDGALELNPANPHAGASPDLDLLTDYLRSLPGPAAPPGDTALIARGEEVFTDLDCGGCHVPPAFTDNALHDVDTGGEFNTPTLNWLWLSEPYFHDGRAAALEEVFTLPGAHQIVGTVTPDDLAALMAYLRSLPRGTESPE